MRNNRLIFMLFFYILVVCGISDLFANEISQNSSSEVYEVLSGLEEKMSHMQTLKADFIQEKNLAIFNQKLILKGTLFLENPARFAWHVKEPMQYSMVVKDNVLRQWDEETKEILRVPLSKNLAFKTIIGQMREWFSGTYTSLLNEYDVIILSNSPLSLQFVPRSASVASNLINSVTVVFREDERYIKKIHIKEKSQDSMILTFGDTFLNIPLTNAAWEVKPRVQ